MEDPGVTPVLLTRADPSCNMHRFYSLELATSLFGECGVVRHRGRVGASGRSRTDWFEKPCEAEAAFSILLRAKHRRGYAP
ncbi:WGR domain-containing protein [Paracoccus sp. S-4012]|nr:WGR domain-containing protein [Paracoccus sp. S-4012]